METISSIFPPLPKFHISLKSKVTTDQLFTVISSQDIATVARECFKDDGVNHVEHFYCVALTRGNKVLGTKRISSGGITGTVADPRVILQFALLINATNLILIHNHPSGSLRPSRADEELTTKIKEAARYFDMSVMDHIILTDTSYFSFADEGLL
jgi:DNA repair protein RadC